MKTTNVGRLYGWNVTCQSLNKTSFALYSNHEDCMVGGWVVYNRNSSPGSGERLVRVKGGHQRAVHTEVFLRSGLWCDDDIVPWRPVITAAGCAVRDG